MTPVSPDTFSLDVNALEDMKRRTREAPSANGPEVARQFEALFLQMAIQRMRDATPKDGLFDSDQTRLVQSMYDGQMAQALANPGIGLAQALLAQMQRGAGAGAGADATNGDADGTPAPFTPLAQPSQVFGGSSGAASAPRRHTAGGLIDAIRASVAMTDTQQAGAARAWGSDTPAHVARFLDKMGDAARAVADASGLPLRLILGQAALESGWGQREIRTADGRTSHNVFGIKATGGWSGGVANVMTTEYVDGAPAKLTQPFRAYASYEEALSDYARLITQSERYRDVVNARDENDAARRIQAAGYATDPAYADKLIRVMQLLPV